MYVSASGRIYLIACCSGWHNSDHEHPFSFDDVSRRLDDVSRRFKVFVMDEE